MHTIKKNDDYKCSSVYVFFWIHEMFQIENFHSGNISIKVNLENDNFALLFIQPYKLRHQETS